MRRIGHGLIFLWPIAIVVPFLQAGCGDDSRTTGTQVQISEEVKAQIDDMRDMYKANKAEAKQKK